MTTEETMWGPERRAARLVTMQIAFYVEGPNGLRMEGLTTGLNENGVAGRANIVSGFLLENAVGTRVQVYLDLPRADYQRPFQGTLLRVASSWVPGFTHFVALSFENISDEDIQFFRRFIQWRDEAYFTEQKPPRNWYIYRTSEQNVYGPLTTEELRTATRRRAISEYDLIWSPAASQWVPFQDDILEEKLKGGEAPPAAAAAAPVVATPASATSDKLKKAMEEAAKFTQAPATVADGGEPVMSRATRRKRFSFARLAFPLLVLALIGAGAGVAFWQGWWDFTEGGSLYREAGKLRLAGRSYEAMTLYDRVRREFPDHRRAPDAEAALAEILAADRQAEDAAGGKTTTGAGTDAEEPAPGTLIVNDFDNDGIKGAELTCPIGIWTGSALDPNVQAVASYTQNVRFGTKGGSLQVQYRVASALPAFAGVWVRLKTDTSPSLNLDGFRFLNFLVRGTESEAGFTQKMTVELRGENQVSSVVISGIGNQWKRFKVPLPQFAGITDWTKIAELRFVLDSATVTDQEGILFIDELEFAK